MIKNAIKRAALALGYEIRRAPPSNKPPERVVRPSYDKIHYASYTKMIPGWLNVDLQESGPENYMKVNLVTKHPFPDDWFRFGFSEDFLEHISQFDAILFLIEAHRTLKPGGVLRVSSPDLRYVLRDGFPSHDFATLMDAKERHYDRNRHIEFFTRESLTTVAEHIGYSVEFVPLGESRHPELRGIDTRVAQAEINLIAELTKQ